MSLTHITMLHTRRGVADGNSLVREYRPGERHAVGETITDMTARRFLREGWAYNSTDDDSLAESEGIPGLTSLVTELSAPATCRSKERVVQNSATLLATGAL